MGAIAGILFMDGRLVPQAMLDNLAAAAPRRGLDGCQTWFQDNYGIVCQAHATTPEAVGERQPFIGTSGAVVVFDGRLDNRPELLELLGAGGAALGAAPDGAIILALYEQLGRDFVRRLAGDYAIAVCHPQQRRLALFASPLSWRPLHWTRQGDRIAFATDARTLVAGLGLERRLNEGALAEFISGRFMTQTETFFAGVERVEQGSGVFFDGDRMQVWLWHDGPFEDWTGRSLRDHVEEFQVLFDQALQATFRSNGAVTAQLSGGLDSSSVVCRATELHRAGKLDRQVLAISARFPGEPHDETAWSTAVENHLGITAEVSRSTPFSIDSAREWVASTYHLPIRPNALDTLAGAVNILHASGRRVMLGGEGGDDWLNGSLAHLPDLLMHGRLGMLADYGNRFFRKDPAPLRMLKIMVLAARPIALPRYRRAILDPTTDWRIDEATWLRREWCERIDLKDRWQGPPRRPGLKGFAQKARYSGYSHGNRQLIAQTAMAFAERQGVEVRHPFHDARLTRFCMGASGVHLRDRETLKLVLREAMKGTLPEVVRTRTDKAKFYVHTVSAIEEILERRPFSEMHPVKLGWVDENNLQAMYAPIRSWYRNRDSMDFPVTPWGPVWFVIAADMWLDQAFGLGN